MIMASPCFCVSKLLLVSMFASLLVDSYSPPPVQPVLCHAKESSALLRFKESFGIDKLACSYPQVLSWTAHGDCCSWDGVYCDEGNGHVIGLDLSSSCLFGSLHSNSSLFELKHLQRLSLAYNDFNYSPIPPQLSLLSTTLTHLDLSRSNFAGQIPSEISMLSKLVVLNLGANVEPSSSTSLLKLKRPTFTSLVQNMTRLEVLVLSWVDISSTVPNTLSNLSSMSTLYLKSCNLVGEFPSSVFLLSNLEYISLRYNQELTGHLPRFNRSLLQSLRLGQTSFSGELPDSIQNLHSLTELDVVYCNFTGPIPSSLGNLANLTYLHLSYNNFRVGDLSWLVDLTNLQTLYMSGINLSSEILYSLASLSYLKSLSLRSCQLTGHIPFWIQNLTQLTLLDLGRNFLQGPVQKCIFSKLVNLELLDLSENNMSGTLELGMFHDMRNLSTLYLGYNQLSIVDYDNGTLPNLEMLDLASCNLHTFPNFLKHQQNLGFLSLGSNKIHGQVPRWFCNTSKETLRMLELSDNLLTGLDQCTRPLPWLNLQFLGLNDNLLRGSLPTPPPSIIEYRVSRNRLTGKMASLFCNLSSLIHLDVGHNNLSGELPPCLGNISNLSLLFLGNNNFSGTIPHLCANGATRLEQLDLSGNQLQGTIPRSLANCTTLRGIDVGHNAISDTFPSWMGKLQGLQLLMLPSNRFHGPILESSNSSEFPSLRIIDLSHNGFSGPLPSALFSKWRAMKKSSPVHFTYMLSNRSYFNMYAEKLVHVGLSMILANKGNELEYGQIPDELAAVDFSSNDFSGEIPESLGILNGLYVLNLANNHLTGTIPSSLANLTVLESLDLSNNKLWGEIPQQLAELNSLEYLNVSHNNLSGQVPRGKQFDTFEDSSFDGNSGLCGELLITKRCRGSAPPPSSVPNGSDVDSSFMDWMVRSMGYAGGLVVGIVIGNELMARKPEWFVKHFGKKMKPRTRKGKRSRRN